MRGGTRLFRISLESTFEYEVDVECVGFQHQSKQYVPLLDYQHLCAILAASTRGKKDCAPQMREIPSNDEAEPLAFETNS
jgi:hypothetical protein